MQISRRDFLKRSAAGIVCLTIPSLLTGCRPDNAGQTRQQWLDRRAANMAALAAAELHVDEIHVDIPGLQREYHFVVINDLHIILPNEEVREDAMEEVMERYEEMAVDEKGRRAYELWDVMVDVIGEMDVDGVLLAADMLDYFSEANVAHMKQGCERLKVPYMYLRADHDYTDVYCEAMPREEAEKVHQTICPNDPVFVMDYEEFLVVGLNNTTDQVTDQAIKQLEEIFDRGKPILLVTHVPYASLVDEGLSEASRAAWNDRVLLWSYSDSLTLAQGNTITLLDMLYAPDSPVAAVLAGHLHFPYDGMLTEEVRQHVFDNSCQGMVGYVVVK